MIALSDLDIQIHHKLISFFDMPLDEIYSSLLTSGLMNLSSLITACETKDKNNPTWIKTVSFCLYDQFLLISPQGDADVRIISIIGLDSFKEQNRLSGSLLLLQVCNQNIYFIFILALTFA